MGSDKIFKGGWRMQNSQKMGESNYTCPEGAGSDTVNKGGERGT